jgi:hypothetical protein
MAKDPIGAVDALRVRLEGIRGRMVGLRGQLPPAGLVRPGEARAALREIKAIARRCEAVVSELARVADQIVGKDKEGEITLGGKLHLTAIEAARRSGMTDSNIRKLIKQGRISGQQHETGWLIDEQSLASFVANRQRRAKRGRPKKTDAL